jgi:chromosome segregation ATPase
MNTLDYINELIKEKEELKELYKKQFETIHLMKIEITKLNNSILKKDKKIQKLESESLNIKTKNELDKVKNDLKKMKTDYKDLQNMYNAVVAENEELKRIFDEIEKSCDSD